MKTYIVPFGVVAVTIAVVLYFDGRLSTKTVTSSEVRMETIRAEKSVAVGLVNQSGKDHTSVTLGGAIDRAEVNFSGIEKKIDTAFSKMKNTAKWTHDEKHLGNRDAVFGVASSLVDLKIYLRSHPEHRTEGVSILKRCAKDSGMQASVRALCVSKSQEIDGEDEQLLSTLDRETLNLLHHFMN